jgi:hypothetical protein
MEDHVLPDDRPSEKAARSLGIDLRMTIGNLLQIGLMLTGLTLWLVSWASRSDETAKALEQYKATELVQQSAAAADDLKRSNDIRTWVTALEARVDGMWRPTDYADRDAHLARLDAVFESLRDRTTKAEYDIKDLSKTVQTLVAVPPRK